MFLSGFLLAAAGVATTVGIECAGFSHPGGWTVETRFPEKGRTYLVADGSGVPVADAWTEFSVPSGGVYHVWVESRNWTGLFQPKIPGAGRFYLIVNGKTLPQELGGGGAGWWGQPSLDDVVLRAGTNRVALHDVSGFGARVASITFSTASRPPSDPKPGVTEEKKVDLVVCGGTVAGLSAAIAAARSGLSIALVNDRAVWGGDNSSEGRVSLSGCANFGDYPRLGDVLSEFATPTPGRTDDPASFGDDLKAAAVRRERNVTPYVRSVLDSVDLDKSGGAVRLASVVIRDLPSGRRTRLVAPLFVDATDSGVLGISAFAESPRDGVGVSRIPEIAFLTQTCRHGSAYRSEPWMLPLEDAQHLYALQGVWKMPLPPSGKINDAEDAHDYALQTFYSNWAYVREHPKKGSRFDASRHRIAWVSPVGTRETRRFTGDLLLTERHLRERKEESDGTCRTTGELATGPIWPSAIPYRCLYSRNVANLFLAGRTISVSREVAVSTDLLRTCGLTGEVVGLAAGVCRRKGCDPRAVGKVHFDDLKAAMAKGAGGGAGFDLQEYNLPKSLEGNLKGKYREAVWDRLRGPLPAQLYIDHMNFIRKNAEASGVPATRAGRTGCDYLEGLIADAKKLGFSTNDLVALHTTCLKLAHNLYLDDRIAPHYEAALGLDPNIRKDITFQARYRVHYNALRDRKRFPLSEEEIGFGKTLAAFGIAERKTVHLKDYWNPTNVAASLQRLIDDPEVTTIVFDRMPTPWYLSGVIFGPEVTGKRLLLKSGCRILRDRASLRNPKRELFGIESAQGVVIESDAAHPEDVCLGDYADAEEKSRLCKGEGRSCVGIGHRMYQRTTRNVVLRNLRIANTAQDALHVGACWDPPENVYVEHCVFDRNLRQGCSPVAYYSLYFKDVKFLNTGGTPPGAGVDIEPWSDYLATVNLYFFDCTFGNNVAGGLLIPAVTHEPMLILAKRCTFQRTPSAQITVTAMPSTYISSEGRPQTDLRFEDCTFESSGRTLSVLPYPIYDMTFRRCLIRDVRLPSQKARGGRTPSPIGIELTRSFGKDPDISDVIRSKITFEDVTVEGFEGAPAIDVSDEIGRMNVKNVFAGALDWNGKRVDLATFAYEGPDLHEPPTPLVPSSKLKKPRVSVAADAKMPRSNAKLCAAGPWWMKPPAHSAYFWAERGRVVTFDLHVWIPDWAGARTNAVYVTSASGRDVKLGDVSKGVTPLSYVAPDTGWHRFTPGFWLDGAGDMNNGIGHRVDNVKGTVFAWQADTRSECYAKFNRWESDKPYVGYFEIPAGGKPCRLRLNFGGLVIRDPAGNVVERVADGTYGRRHVFTLKPSSDKAEIWSFEQPAGREGGSLVGMRFYAPLNGIWADSPEALPCEYTEHFVPAKRAADDAKKVDVRLDVKKLPPEVAKALPAAKAARKAFAAKREAAAKAQELAEVIAKMKAKGMTDDIQREVNDIAGGREVYVRAAAMEAKAAKETSEVFEVAAFCQAFAPLVVLESARVKEFVAWKASDKPLAAFSELSRELGAPTFENRLAEELRMFGLGYPKSVLEYDDPMRLMALLEAILEKI